MYTCRRFITGFLCIMLLMTVIVPGGSIAPAKAAESNANPNSSFHDTQRNSLNMLNYLAVLTQQINASKNSRLYVEDAYSSLINNIHPNAIDENTQFHLASILDTLENYRMIAVQRERLKYISEQNQAHALRNSLPNPIGLLSLVKSGSLTKAAISIAYMAVDSYASYISQSAQNEQAETVDGWALDDDEARTLHNLRKQTFNYMIETVNAYSLAGDLALNENAVNEFVSWKNNKNRTQRILFLESNINTYKAFGLYWLTLAQSYYDNGDFDKCLDAISTYDTLQTRIFRKDYDLAKTLPLAIAAAKEVKESKEYLELATQFAEKIVANTDNTDWSLRFFAAQTFVELYELGKDQQHLKKAYAITMDNVNHLANTQKVQNQQYLSAYVATPIPKGATKAVKASIESYNKQVQKERTTALAPVFEPFLLNCELLFAIADGLNIDKVEKAKIDSILHENGEDIFLIPSLDNMYRYNQSAEKTEEKVPEIVFLGKEITLPSRSLTRDAEISVTITDPSSDSHALIKDWELIKIERKDDHDINSFNATFKSPTAEKHSFVPDSKVKVEVIPNLYSSSSVLSAEYEVVANKSDWWEVVKVWEGNVKFERISH